MLLRWMPVLFACAVGIVNCGCESSAPQESPTGVPTAPAINSPAASTTPTSSADMQTTDSGLKYKVITAGSDKKPTATNTVTVNYRGWLDDGTEFDAGKDISFPLNGVIPGWTEGLQLVGEGGKIELEIPANLAYGNQNIPGIPAGSTLHFDVDLLKVE